MTSSPLSACASFMLKISLSSQSCCHIYKKYYYISKIYISYINIYHTLSYTVSNMFMYMYSMFDSNTSMRVNLFALANNISDHEQIVTLQMLITFV